MKSAAFALALAAMTSGGFVAAACAAEAPCEDRLDELRATMKGAALSETDMASVKALEAKAVERCNADDDRRANRFSADALAMLKK